MDKLNLFPLSALGHHRLEPVIALEGLAVMTSVRACALFILGMAELEFCSRFVLEGHPFFQLMMAVIPPRFLLLRAEVFGID